MLRGIYIYFATNLLLYTYASIREVGLIFFTFYHKKKKEITYLQFYDSLIWMQILTSNATYVRKNRARHSLKSLWHASSYIFMTTLMSAVAKCIRRNPQPSKCRQYEICVLTTMIGKYVTMYYS